MLVDLLWICFHCRLVQARPIQNLISLPSTGFGLQAVQCDQREVLRLYCRALCSSFAASMCSTWPQQSLLKLLWHALTMCSLTEMADMHNARISNEQIAAEPALCEHLEADGLMILMLGLCTFASRVWRYKLMSMLSDALLHAILPVATKWLPSTLHRDYKDIIKHCFMDDGHLRFELRKPEAQNLCRAFERNSPGMPGTSDAFWISLPDCTLLQCALTQHVALHICMATL